MYAQPSTRADIAYPVHKLCQCLTKPTPELIAETDHIFGYLARTSSLGLTHQGLPQAGGVLWTPPWEERNSTSGWLVLWQSAAISWGSAKQKSVRSRRARRRSSRCPRRRRTSVYVRKLLSGLGVDVTDPTELYTDSKSARDISYNPEQHSRMKHVLRRHFFVRDMVEEFEISVPFVRTADNWADFFTKPMKSAKEFTRMRAEIMNEPRDSLG